MPRPSPAAEKYQAFREIANEIGELLVKKNTACGNSFNKAVHILKVLFPEGVKPEQYRDLLAITRVIDKMFRIATDRDALGENPWRDIAGYSILSVEAQEQEKKSSG
jgi:hypothetical protein